MNLQLVYRYCLSLSKTENTPKKKRKMVPSAGVEPPTINAVNSTGAQPPPPLRLTPGPGITIFLPRMANSRG